MKKSLLDYFKKNNISDPNLVDKLIISAYYHINNLTPKNNKLILSCLINENQSVEYDLLKKLCKIIVSETESFELEELILCFEFVISPHDRIVNGAVYTPQHIRTYITDQAISQFNKIDGILIADISCGCGGFLYNAAKYIHENTGKCYSDIFKENIFGIDIQEYSVQRTKLLLSTLAIINNEDNEFYSFNLFTDDTLSFNWHKNINSFSGFDVIIGNPPYVCSRNLTDDTKKKLSRWDVCSSGNPDLYIPFFQIGVELLSKNGVLGYITMNSFFKSLNGRSLRQYFQSIKIDIKIIDFGAEQVFASKNTYTCICFIQNKKSMFLHYKKINSKKLQEKKPIYDLISYTDINALKGWNLDNHKIMSKIEKIGTPFGSRYKTRHGIATLKNDVFIFTPTHEDSKYYYLKKNKNYKIEKSICRNIINSNKLSRKHSLNELIEKLIFPYSNEDKPKILNEKFLKDNYPNAYIYLLDNKEKLSTRDKGKGVYPNWFAFGRTQSLERVKNKLFLPKISKMPPEGILSNDENMMFYNGIAIINSSMEELAFIKKIIESRLFWTYIKTTSKPYSDNYYSLNGNYINNFGMKNFSPEEINYIINEKNKNKLDLFLESKYGVDLS